MPEPTFDVAAAHRWFAIEANNGAWDLVEQATRTSAECTRLLHLAHVSCWHWQAVGKPIHQLRGLTLLTTAYVAAGLFESAVRFGEESLAVLRDLKDEAPPFDQACAHAAMAAAYHACGRKADAEREAGAAKTWVAKFDSTDDRTVFERLYPSPR